MYIKGSMARVTTTMAATKLILRRGGRKEGQWRHLKFKSQLSGTSNSG
uniref:Uncharacterized protein n=1 Tax=Zea mays TaxID=4577 RepID=C4J0X5_MAIZE|nr:unknown [Zea mays]ACR37555.1 unknown [Zea mays]